MIIAFLAVGCVAGWLAAGFSFLAWRGAWIEGRRLQHRLIAANLTDAEIDDVCEQFRRVGAA